MRFARVHRMSTADARLIDIEVAYARSDEQAIIALQVPQGTTIGQALCWSKIQQRFPEIDLANAKVGIFGKLSTLSAILQTGDRVEIYRPLVVDPKRLRRQRAARSAGR